MKPVPTLPSAFVGFTVTKRCKGCKNPLKDNVCFHFPCEKPPLTRSHDSFGGDPPPKLFNKIPSLNNVKGDDRST